MHIRAPAQVQIRDSCNPITVAQGFSDGGSVYIGGVVVASSKRGAQIDLVGRPDASLSECRFARKEKWARMPHLTRQAIRWEGV